MIVSMSIILVDANFLEYLLAQKPSVAWVPESGMLFLLNLTAMF